jgi:hypothetical protein
MNYHLNFSCTSSTLMWELQERWLRFCAAHVKRAPSTSLWPAYGQRLISGHSTHTQRSVCLLQRACTCARPHRGARKCDSLSRLGICGHVTQTSCLCCSVRTNTCNLGVKKQQLQNIIVWAHPRSHDPWWGYKSHVIYVSQIGLYFQTEIRYYALVRNQYAYKIRHTHVRAEHL